MLAGDDDLVKVKAVVAYRGDAFHGFAEQAGDLPTVAGSLRRAIEQVLRHPVDLTGAGRTDAGVHAWGQVVSFDTTSDRFDPDRTRRSINALCGPAIAVRSLEATSDDFDARFSAQWRQYRYDIANDPVASPLRSAAWHVPTPLSLDLLRLACDPLLGEHDFAAFCKRSPNPDATTIRRVLDARWTELHGDEGRLLRFEIRATAFCHNMVRSIVGTLVDVGLGRRTAGSIAATLRSCDRANAGPVAPPHGLTLWEVGY
jgi:tRNA pseudouridine38-40 synthase